MINVATDLVGAIVVVSRMNDHWRQEYTREVHARGCVRAVTTSSNGEALHLWIEELDEAELACWFTEQTGRPPRAEIPGNLIFTTVDYSGMVAIIRKPKETP